MINVHGIRRNVKNVVKNYTDAQVKVREATSNDPWGPSSTLMGEIADLTYNVVAFSEIMQMIWKRLNDHGKNWRHVYKALVLLEYMIKTGSEKVAQQCKENIFAIQTLKDFQYVEENKDQGMNVREKSKQLVSLLKDDERLRNERARALKAKERFAQSASHEALAGYQEVESGGSPTNGAASPRECARPQTAGEEELQLQLALAMSKEEAELEERLRRNDDLRLKMAITESQEDFKRGPNQDTSPKPNDQQHQQNNPLDDLLGLQMAAAASALPPPPPPAPSLHPHHHPHHHPGPHPLNTDPWGMPLNNTQAQHQQASGGGGGPWGGSRASPTPIVVTPDDPWRSKGAPSPPVRAGSITTTGDPWGGNGVPLGVGGPLENDPWTPKHPPTSSASMDAMGNLGNLNSLNGETDDFDLLSKRTAVTTPDLRTANSFEGSSDSRTSPNPFDLSTLNDSLLSTNQTNRRDLTNENIQQLIQNQQARKTPETFLGANSNLVNLDALVSTKNTVSQPAVPGGAPVTNPFQPASTFNPFQAAKPPPPSINQLRAQNQFGPPGLAAPPLTISPNVTPPLIPSSGDMNTGYNPATSPTSNPFL